MGFAKENQMGEKTALRRPIVALAVLVGMAIAAAPAAAKTEDIIAPSPIPPGGTPTKDNGWQAGTCKKDVPDTVEQCSIATEGQFFEEAGAHPQIGFTQFIVAHKAPGET